MRVVYFLVIIFFTPLFAIGQISAPKYSNEFLAIGVGARGLALSGAMASTTNDANAAYWNPAGLLNIQEDYQLSLMHAEYFAGIAKYDYLGFATSIDSTSHLAISLIRFGVDDIPDTRFLYDASGALNYDNIRFFSAVDYALFVSFAHKLPWLGGIKAGMNAKIVHRGVGSFANAWGFGLDAGLQYDRPKWYFGLMMRDITGTFNAWTYNTEELADIFTQTGNEIPQSSIEVTLPKLTLSVARKFLLGKDRFGLLPTVDLDMTFDGERNTLIKTNVMSIDPKFGLEADYKNLVYLRLGAGTIQQVKDFDGSSSYSFQATFGLGIALDKFTIDYALTDVGDQSESLYSHVFSVLIKLNKDDIAK